MIKKKSDSNQRTAQNRIYFVKLGNMYAVQRIIQNETFLREMCIVKCVVVL